MIINHNMNAMNAHRNMGMNVNNAGKSMEKLSSGLRINRAGDDAAGLAISEKMRGQIRGLDQASRNAQDGISMIQTAEGALNETQNILQRMRELSVQAGNDTNTADDRAQIQKEIEQLTEEIDRIGNNTEFNTQNLLDGNKAGTAVKVGDQVTVPGYNADGAKKEDLSALAQGDKITINNKEYTIGTAVDNDAAIANLKGQLVTDGYTVDETTVTAVEIKKAESQRPATATDVKDGKVTLQVGANENQIIEFEVSDMRAEALGVDNIKVTNKEDASASITTLDAAIKNVSEERAKLGAVQNRLEYTTKNLDNTSENLQGAESRIRDVDMAKEMLNFSKNNILQQAAQSMVAQAKQQPEGVLQLLR